MTTQLRGKVKGKMTYSLKLVNSVPRFTGHQPDLPAYPIDPFGGKL